MTSWQQGTIVSEQTEPHVFFADTAAPAEAPAPAVVEPKQMSASRGEWRSRIKGIHVFLVAAAGGLLWMVLTPNGSSTNVSVSAASTGDPAASRYAADLEAAPPATGISAPSEVQSFARESVAASQTVSIVTPAASSPAGTTAASSPTGSDVMSELQTLRSQVASLETALKAEHLQRAACPAPNYCPTSTAATHAAPRHVARKGAARVPREVLVDYHLNTIYNGQAWIERANQTFVVEKGGQIGGARVERIDAAAHVVETTLGDIR